MGAQIRLDICGHEFPTAGSILGPVSEITQQSGGGNLRKGYFSPRHNRNCDFEIAILTNELTHSAKRETETFNVTAPVSKRRDGKQLETSVLSYLQSGADFSWLQLEHPEQKMLRNPDKR